MALRSSFFISVPLAGSYALRNLNATTYYTELISGSNFIAAGFQTDNASYALTSVTALLRQDVPGALTFRLYSNAAQPSANDLGSQPGILVGSLASPSSYPAALGPVTFGGNNVQLSPDTTYWLVMSAAASGTYEWAYAANNTGSGAGFYPSWGTSTDAGRSWYTSDLQPMQMSVTANPVSSAPEPGVTSLLLVGLAVAGLKRWKSFSR